MTAAATVQTRLEEQTEPFVQFRCGEMVNHDYSILVYHYLLGQFRIVLTDCRLPDLAAPAGHGSIVQVLCTYKHATLAKTLTLLRHSKEPLELARSWATPTNCECAGGRIRLDGEAS
ncbi:MAG: hypothetical protein V7609_2128 [Verrucomicrobiota bacterium]